MSKKSKKFDAGVDSGVTEATAPVEGTNKPKPPIMVAKPQLYLQHADGTQYQFTRFPMPKRVSKQPEGAFQITVDGKSVPAWVTSSKGWAATDKSIEYIWAYVTDAEGLEPGGYITLDYGVAASGFAGTAFTVGAGKANRENPKREPGKPDVEANRKAKFTEVMTAKKAAAEAAAPTEPQA